MAQPEIDPVSGTLLLELDKAEVGLDDRPVTFEGRRFQPKSEVHITLIGKDLGAEVRAAAERDPAVLDRLRRALAETDWDYRLSDAWYHVSQAQENGLRAETIIRMAEVPGLKAFYRRLGEVLKRPVEVPPAHVTLYTRNTAEGIGLASGEEFRRYAVRAVDPGELQG